MSATHAPTGAAAANGGHKPEHPAEQEPEGHGQPDGLAALMSMLHRPGSSPNPAELRQEPAKSPAETGKAPAMARLLVPSSGPVSASAVNAAPSGDMAAHHKPKPQGAKGPAI
jgi:hypothetical protein